MRNHACCSRVQLVSAMTIVISRESSGRRGFFHISEGTGKDTRRVRRAQVIFLSRERVTTTFKKKNDILNAKELYLMKKIAVSLRSVHADTNKCQTECISHIVTVTPLMRTT